MLAALKVGVKGSKWFTLMDKVYSARNLAEAFEAVKANKGAAGADHQSITMFEERLPQNLKTPDLRGDFRRYPDLRLIPFLPLLKVASSSGP